MLATSKSIASKPPLRTGTFTKALAGLILLFIMPLEGMLQSTLCRSGADVVLDIQEGMGTTAGYRFFKGLSYIGSDWVLLMLPPVLYHFYNPKVAVKVTLVLCMSLYVDSILNMIYCEPRPFWVISDINGELCLEGYANPASEITMFVVAYFYTAVMLTHELDLFIQFGFYSFGVLLTFLLAFGLIYLGILFIHQAITTLCFDFMYLVICIAIDSVLTKITKLAAFNYSVNRVQTVYWFIITTGLMLGAIAVYDLITIQQVMDISWVENATEDCDIRFDVGSDYSFFVSASVFFNYGLMLGSMHVGKVMDDFWWASAYWKRAVRTVVACGITIGLYFLFSTSYTDLIPTRDTTTRYCYHFIVLYLLSAYITAMLVPWAAKYLRLNNDDESLADRSPSSGLLVINRSETELNSVSP